MVDVCVHIWVLRAFIVGVMSWDSMHALLEFGIMHTR